MLNLIGALLDATEEVNALAQLDDGWNYGHGVTPDPVVIDRSKSVLQILFASGAREFEVFPEDDGGVMIAGYREHDRFEILARSDGRYESTYQDEATALVDSISDLLELLRIHGWQSKRSSGSFTRYISAAGNADIPRSRFVIRPGVSLLSTPTVSRRPDARFATISADSTPQGSEAHRPAFGEFKSRNLLQLTS